MWIVYGPRLIATPDLVWFGIRNCGRISGFFERPDPSSPRAPMDFRELSPQCPRGLGRRRAGPHIRFRKRWDPFAGLSTFSRCRSPPARLESHVKCCSASCDFADSPYSLQLVSKLGVSGNLISWNGRCYVPRFAERTQEPASNSIRRRGRQPTFMSPKSRKSSLRVRASRAPVGDAAARGTGGGRRRGAGSSFCRSGI